VFNSPFMMDLIIFIFGLAIGSFLNVCIYRIPKGESIISPPSRCPKCKREIKFYDNIPIISFILLRGRCRYCGATISWQYPIVEFITGIFAVTLLEFYGITLSFFIYFFFICALIVVSCIDLRERIIPDIISLPGIAIGFFASFFLPSINYLDSIIGIVAGGGILLLVGAGYQLIMKTEGMGGGDIKLLAMMGAFLGWKAVIFILLVSSFLGAIIGSILALIKREGRKYEIPYGPFLSIAAILYIYFGRAIIYWYLGLIFHGRI